MDVAAGKRVLVTGAASGFGLCATRLLSELGNRVLAGVLNDDQLSRMRCEFPQESDQVEIFKLDLTSSEDVERAGELEIDVMVNNASFGAQVPFRRVHSAWFVTFSKSTYSGPSTRRSACWWDDSVTSTMNRFAAVHAISFVTCNIIHLTNWIFNGIPERFPGLTTIWIESGLAWIPFLMQRLDHE